jgi:hypothetical protein
MREGPADAGPSLFVAASSGGGTPSTPHLRQTTPSMACVCAWTRPIPRFLDVPPRPPGWTPTRWPGPLRKTRSAIPRKRPPPWPPSSSTTALAPRWSSRGTGVDPVSPPPLPRRHSWLLSRAEACAPLPPGYRPRDVESEPLHRAVRHHRAAFTAAAARRGHDLPPRIRTSSNMSGTGRWRSDEEEWSCPRNTGPVV